MKPPQHTATMFLWHHEEDAEFARGLAQDLALQGLEVYSKGDESTSGEKAFNSADWRMAKSAAIVFLISYQALADPQLINDIEKALRREAVVVVPALLEEIASRDLPVLLRFMLFIDVHGDNHQAVSQLAASINRPNQSYTRNPIRWIIEHFRRYLILPPLTFCWQITVENLIVSLLLTGLIHLLFQPETRTNLSALSASAFLWLVIIVGPVVETVALQVAPVFLARRLGLSFFGQILFSVIPFALLHFTRSIGTGIGAGIIGGFYSAFTYVHWRQKSLWKAYWVTALSHGLHNLALFAMLIGEF